VTAKVSALFILIKYFTTGYNYNINITVWSLIDTRMSVYNLFAI